MADHYQKEDGTGNYLLEDSSGSYLLEIQESELTVKNEDLIGSGLPKRKNRLIDGFIPNLLMTTLASVVTQLRVPIIQGNVKIRRRYVTDEVQNLLTSTLAQSQVNPFFTQELDTYSKKPRLKVDNNLSQFTNNLIPPFTQLELDSIRVKARTKLAEVAPDLLNTTLASLLANPFTQSDLDRLKVKLHKLVSDDIINVTLQLSSQVSTIERAAIIQKFIQSKKYKRVEEITNLLLTTLSAPVVVPFIQQELSNLRFKVHRLIPEPELNLLMTTLGTIIAPRYHQLPKGRVIKRLRQSEEIANLLMTTLGTMPFGGSELLIDKKRIQVWKQRIYDIPNLLSTTLGIPLGTGFTPTCKLILNINRSIVEDFECSRSELQVLQIHSALTYTKELVTP